MRRSNDSVSSFNTRIIVSFSIFWFQFKLTRWVFALLTTRWTERIHFECWKINNDRVFRQWFHCSIISSFIQDSGLCLNLSPVNEKWKKGCDLAAEQWKISTSFTLFLLLYLCWKHFFSPVLCLSCRWSWKQKKWHLHDLANENKEEQVIKKLRQFPTIRNEKCERRRKKGRKRTFATVE